MAGRPVSLPDSVGVYSRSTSNEPPGPNGTCGNDVSTVNGPGLPSLAPTRSVLTMISTSYRLVTVTVPELVSASRLGSY